jgi:hypothetical protein
MSVDVTIIGLDRLRAWLDTAPARFEAALWAAAEDSGQLQADAIRADTPELTGTLAGSIASVVEKGADGIEVRTGTSVPYGPFVENGTRQHGEAHHMFQHGAQEATPEVEGVFHNAIRSITSTFGNI